MRNIGMVAATALAALSSGAAWAQDDPGTVGVSVEGTVVDVPIDVAVEACGMDAETLRAQWAAMETQLETMADTTVNADATDLAPGVEADTQMDSAIDGRTVSDGADATHEADGDVATDVSSDDAEVTGSAAATDETAEPASDAPGTETAEAGGEATDGPATPTAGTVLSKAAVCEISQDTADQLGIATSG